MNRWKIEILFKSGKWLTAYDMNDEVDSHNVLHHLVDGRHNIISLSNDNGDANILVMKDEIAAMTISEA